MKRTLALLLTAAASAAAQPAQNPLIVEQVRVFDGTSVIPETNVVVEGGVIRAVGTPLNCPRISFESLGCGKPRCWAASV